MRKLKERCGAALLEIIISIAVLGLLVVPISSGLLMSMRINGKSEQVFEARLAVSSAVETLMAHGVEAYNTAPASFDFEGVTIYVDKEGSAWKVTVTSDVDSSIYATTYIRDKEVRAS